MKTLFFLAGISALPLSMSAQSVLNEAFARDSRQDFAAGTSAQWYTSKANSIVYTAGESLTQNTESSSQLTGYFRAAGDPLSISVGERLVLSFDVTFDRATPLTHTSNSFRAGLYNSSSGTQINGDGVPVNSTTAFDNYTGYVSMVAHNPATNFKAALNIRERTKLTGQTLLHGAHSYTMLRTAGVTPQRFEPNVTYTGILTLQRTAKNQLAVSMEYTGGALGNYSVHFVDKTPSEFSFDTVAFWMIGGAADSFTLSRVEVAVSAIP